MSQFSTSFCLSVPRSVGFARIQLQQQLEAGLDSKIGAETFLQAVLMEPKVRRMIGSWNSSHDEHALRGLKALHQLQAPCSMPADSMVQAADELLMALDQSLQDTESKAINPRSLRAQRAAAFCIESLVRKLKTMSFAEQQQFRRLAREQYCRDQARLQGQTELIPAMTTGLFTLRIIPEVKRQLEKEGLYASARRPRKLASS